jgi:hypothetical protein
MDKHYLDVNQFAGFASIKKLKEATKSNYQQTQKYLQTVDAYTKTKRVIRKFKRLQIIARHSEKGPEVAKGLKLIIEREPRCRLILSDLGLEFYNKHVT